MITKNFLDFFYCRTLFWTKAVVTLAPTVIIVAWTCTAVAMLCLHSKRPTVGYGSVPKRTCKMKFCKGIFHPASCHLANRLHTWKTALCLQEIVSSAGIFRSDWGHHLWYWAFEIKVIWLWFDMNNIKIAVCSTWMCENKKEYAWCSRWEQFEQQHF